MARTPDALNQLSAVLVDAALRVHSDLGPGLLESAYARCYAHELVSRGVEVRLEVPVPLIYRGVTITPGYRLDMLVEGEIVVENKAAQAFTPIYEAQLITYLKLTGLRLGFLINWNVPRIRMGLRRIVLNL